MKTIFLILISLILFYSCSDLNDLHQPYLDRGETIYTEKPDSLISFSGLNRVKLQWFVFSDISIKKARIYWNNKIDSLDVDLVVNSGVRDTFSTIVENIPEGGYFFEVVTLDAFGNKSVAASRSGKSLGNRYRESLDDRRILSHLQTATDIVFKIASNSPEDYVTSEFTFIDMNGVQQKSLLIADNLTTLTIPLADIDLSKNIEYRSVYNPFGNAIDLFYTDYNEYIID